MRKLMYLLCAMLLSASVWAQQRTVRGRVTDPAGNPVSGVTINVKGTATSTQSATDGAFSITADNGATLVFSSVGFDRQEVAVTGDEPLTVSLRNQTRELTEVVVTALGQTRSRDKVGYSAATFRSDEVTRVAPVSPLDGLQGKIAGADISTIGGVPGSSSRIILRGYTSLSTTGNNQPLIVVDGVPFNNSRLGSFNDFLNSGGVDIGNGLNDLNPNDIESVSVLKGAAASSLYGSRAQNGVVIITTKRGRAGRLSVDLVSSTIVSSVAKLPEFQNTFGQGWNAQHYKEENGSWGPKMDGRDRLWGSEVDNSRLIKPFSPVMDNIRNFYDNGLELNNTVAVRGGNENSLFYLSYGNVHNNGTLPGYPDVYRRNTIAVRGQTKANRFLASASMNYINKNGSTVNTNDDDAGSSTFENIIQVPRDMHLVDFKDYHNKFFNVDNYFTPYAANPYFSLYENGNRYQNDRFFGNAELGFDFTRALNLRWRTGIDVANARVRDYQAIEAPKSGSWRGPNPTNAEGASYTAKVGGVRELSDYVREINTDLFLNYNYDVSGDFNVSGFVGGNYNDQESRRHSSRVTGLTIPGYYNITNSANDPTTATASSRRRLLGAFAQANLSFKDYLFLTLNARNDWSSTLPQDKNSYFYPGANASLVMSRLLDLGAAKVSYWKLRAAIGRTGKDAPVYSLESTLAAGNAGVGAGNLIFPINGVSGFELSNIIGNSELRPELTTEIEFGTEFRFLNNRLGADIAWYRKRSDGQIMSVPIAPSTGYMSLITNFGLVENKGVELSLNAVPVQSKDFNWNITYTFSRNRNKILELPEGLDKVDFNTYFDVKMTGRVGRPIGVIEAPRPLMTEDGKFVTSNGFYVNTPTDEEYGTIERDYMMGLNNQVTYKNWTLSFSIDYRRGGYFVSRTADLTYFVGNAPLTAYNDRRPFIIPNSVVQNGTDGQGKPIYEENITPIDMTNVNSYWYHTSNDAFVWQHMILPKDFMKLRDVTLTFRLPAAWAQRVRAQSASLTAVGRNFLLWVPQKNTFVDPEATNLGNDILGEFGEQATAPTTKTYGLSLKVNF
ncbi:MAG TPA: SusC/RagA family TonB-linked outer membrane protein [Chitinophagaceae bacterium]|nr:SusC/RagA family TonB-linked outer membrane protein [Chitinophagaceae bacterium]